MYTGGEWKAVEVQIGRWCVVSEEGEMIAEVQEAGGVTAEENARAIAQLPRMVRALGMVGDALAEWMEIAREDDRRRADTLALKAALRVMQELTGPRGGGLDTAGGKVVGCG